MREGHAALYCVVVVVVVVGGICISWKGNLFMCRINNIQNDDVKIGIEIYPFCRR